MSILGNNTAYVASRAKAKVQSNGQTRLDVNPAIPDQLMAVADSGYRTKIDLYTDDSTGGDLVEAALTHNLQNELNSIINMQW